MLNRLQLLFVCCFVFAVSGSAQVTFSENFDSFNPGDLIAASDNVNWTTWTNSPGSSEDAPISDEQAYSGTNSLKLEGTQGPTDLVLLFGDKYEIGTFDFTTQLYVASGKGAYWNFQGEETIGVSWALEFRLSANGTYIVNSAGTNHLTGTYPQGEWFEVKMAIDLSSNVWTLYFNGVEEGSFSNSINAVASCDIFPYETTSGALFYMDDISYEYNPPQLLDNNVILNGATLNRYSLVNTDNTLSLEVQNWGNNEVNSITVDWNDGTAHSEVIDVTIPSLGTVTVDHPVAINFPNAVEHNIEVTVTAVNSLDDEDTSDNNTSKVITTLTQLPEKKVLFEEATGTWCPWCVRGTVSMAHMEENYPETFIGVAVHSGDPMQIDDYAQLSDYIAGYPNATIDRVLRDASVNVPLFESYHDQQMAAGAAVDINANATLNGTELTVDASAIFRASFSSVDYRLAVILTEDGVTGTSSGYNQANAYAGGGNGPMGGYENLPNPVPAADMVYDHVARAILGSFDGQVGSIPASIDADGEYTYTFNYSIPADFAEENMHIVVVVVDNATGNILNANTFGMAPNSNTEIASPIDLKVFPNPTASNVNVTFDAEGDYQVYITNISGKLMASKQFTNLSGEQVVEFDVSGYAAGSYVLTVSGEQSSYSKTVIIK